MKRNIQEQQWAEKLKEWEATSSSQAWERPSAGGWDRITENLPKEEKKPQFVWWTMALFILIGVGAGFYVYSFQKNDSSTDFNENNLAKSNLIKETADSSKEVFVATKTINENKKTEQANELTISSSNSVNNELNRQKTTTEAIDIQNQKIEKQPVSTTIDIEQKNRLETNQIKTSLPQASIINDFSPTDTPSSSKIISESDGQKTKAINNLSLIETIEPSINRISNKESKLIPTLAFGVLPKEVSLEIAPSFNKKNASIWSIDVYAQYSFQPSFYNFSPLWSLQQTRGTNHEKNQSYGIQLNRSLGKGFSAHIGVQKRNSFYKTKGRFVRNFNTNEEDGMGRSIYQFSIALSGDKNIEEDVKILRNSGESIPSGTTLRFNVERTVSIKTTSIPIGIAYTFFQSYPFQLSGVFGGEYSRIKMQSKRTHLSIQHPGFRVEEVHTRNRNNETFVSSDFSLQAGLRLDVYLRPSIKALVQLDWQGGKTQNTPGPLLGTGNQARLGLSYDL